MIIFVYTYLRNVKPYNKKGMKIRTDFVTNLNSSLVIVCNEKITEKVILNYENSNASDDITADSGCRDEGRIDSLTYIEQGRKLDEDRNKNVNIIVDENGKSIVFINDIRFKTRRSIDWGQVEEYLKEYIGKCYEIIETSEKVYIGSDFPDEFCHADDKIKLKGANEKAKANMVSAIGELIKVAKNKIVSEDFGKKHGTKAVQGWYRYDTRFGIPMYDSEGNLEKYNIYSARMIVRCDREGKLYLYDLIRTKKETSSPFEP